MLRPSFDHSTGASGHGAIIAKGNHTKMSQSSKGYLQRAEFHLRLYHGTSYEYAFDLPSTADMLDLVQTYS
jgi:hypothetical protein